MEFLPVLNLPTSRRKVSVADLLAYCIKQTWVAIAVTYLGGVMFKSLVTSNFFSMKLLHTVFSILGLKIQIFATIFSDNKISFSKKFCVFGPKSTNLNFLSFLLETGKKRSALYSIWLSETMSML